MGSDWSPQFSFLYKITGWTVVELEVSYLRSQGGDSVDEMVWGLLVKSDASVDGVISHLAAGMKSLSNKTISDKFNSFIVAIADNRPLIATRLVLTNCRVTNNNFSVIFKNTPREFSHIKIMPDHQRQSTEPSRSSRNWTPRFRSLMTPLGIVIDEKYC